MERWVIAMKKADFYAIGEKYHISPILARLIRNRDIVGDENIDFYLNGTIADLYDGMLMQDMDRAVEILSEKIREEKRIRVIGDYDIDGIHPAGRAVRVRGRGRYRYSRPNQGWIRIKQDAH